MFRVETRFTVSNREGQGDSGGGSGSGSGSGSRTTFACNVSALCADHSRVSPLPLSLRSASATEFLP